jgi:hypothetical protein
MATSKKLGGLPYKKDKRDLKLGSYQTPVEVPTEFKQDFNVLERLYQAHWPACGSHAGGIFKMIQEYLQTGKAEKLSPNHLWIEIKKIDGYKLEDGTDMRSIFKTLQDIGLCSYKLLPNDYSLDLEAYSNPRRVSTKMSADANRNKIKAYAFSNIDLSSIKQAIYNNKAVLLLIYCDDGWFGTNTPTFTKKKYGHFVVGVGYDKNYIYVIDSTEKDLKKSDKRIPIKKLDFIRQLGTAIDLDTDFIFVNTLRRGDENEDVKQLQIRLKMDKEDQIGIFGPKTFLAVKEYQKRNGIPATGLVAELTRAALNQGRN